MARNTINIGRVAQRFVGPNGERGKPRDKSRNLNNIRAARKRERVARAEARRIARR